MQYGEPSLRLPEEPTYTEEDAFAEIADLVREDYQTEALVALEQDDDAAFDRIAREVWDSSEIACYLTHDVIVTNVRHTAEALAEELEDEANAPCVRCGRATESRDEDGTPKCWHHGARW